MLNFNFYNPTRIVFGKGRMSSLAREIPAQAKVLLTYGGGSIKTNGIYDQIKQALHDYHIIEFGGIEPNPTYETLIKGVDLARKEGVDYLLAVGGGSVIDGTKFIAAALYYQGEDSWEILSQNARVKKAMPIGVLLTLPASGSEMNGNAVISRRSENAKLAFYSTHVYPRFAILDPTTSFSLPPRQTANGIIDTFVHVIEQYLTYPVQASLQDRMAEGILLTLIEEGPRAMTDPQNYDVRANLMWCATMGLNGLIGAGVPQDWSTHMIGQEITALHGIDHAITLAIVLPSILTVGRQAKYDKLLQYARRVWGIDVADKDRAVDAAIARTRDFFESLGIKTRLRDYGISASSIPLLTKGLQEHGLVKLGENRDITPDIASQVLELSL